MVTIEINRAVAEAEEHARYAWAKEWPVHICRLPE
jgi:hypothetical protein